MKPFILLLILCGVTQLKARVSIAERFSFPKLVNQTLHDADDYPGKPDVKTEAKDKNVEPKHFFTNETLVHHDSKQTLKKHGPPTLFKPSSSSSLYDSSVSQLYSTLDKHHDPVKYSKRQKQKTANKHFNSNKLTNYHKPVPEKKVKSSKKHPQSKVKHNTQSTKYRPQANSHEAVTFVKPDDQSTSQIHHGPVGPHGHSKTPKHHKQSTFSKHSAETNFQSHHNPTKSHVQSNFSYHHQPVGHTKYHYSKHKPPVTLTKYPIPQFSSHEQPNSAFSSKHKSKGNGREKPKKKSKGATLKTTATIDTPLCNVCGYLSKKCTTESSFERRSDNSLSPSASCSEVIRYMCSEFKSSMCHNCEPKVVARKSKKRWMLEDYSGEPIN